MMKLFEPRCKHRHTREEHPQCFVKELKKGNLPKILILDIETSPMEVFVWGLKDNNYIPITNIINDFFILSWSAKWLFDPVTITKIVTPKDAIDRDDKKILSELWLMLDEADIVIAHNGRQFDIRKLNTRFILNGYPPVSTFDLIDTLTVCRSIFGFSSNALAYLNKILGLSLKTESGGIELWKACLKGDRQALSKLGTYNANDVNILEELYLKIRPWIKSHPNVGLYMELEKPTCKNCGSTELSIVGTTHTPVGNYTLVRCECGAVGRLNKNLLTKDKKENVVR